MNCSMEEVLKFVQENDVKFIRLAFCDLIGVQKNISIMPCELERAFTNGISFDASAVKGFSGGVTTELFLHPDPGTLSILPWRPMTGRVARFFCDITYADGTPFERDGRALLKKVVESCAREGYSCRISTESEFYLFQLDERQQPTKIPHDNGGYLDVAPLDRGENVRREICLTLEEMGLRPESSHHEQGPGQNEIDFHYSSALEAADNFITFKWVVKTSASRNGLHATFMPKPAKDLCGSGLHINMSLSKNGENLFVNDPQRHNPVAESFIAGILNRICCITAFLNPTLNSYQRLNSDNAPGYVSWSHENHSQLIRIPAAVGDSARMELRSADNACNPYIALALLISAGMEGIANKEPLPKPSAVNFASRDADPAGLTPLPKTLAKALMLAESSEFVRSVLPESLLSAFLAIKHSEAVGDERAEAERYFRAI